jgi:periplasmic protein CpxP/Spy
MSMKVFYAFGVFLCLMVISVFAQDQQPSADAIVSQMQSKLNLTADQVAAVSPIIEKYTSQRQELRQGMEEGTVDRDTLRSQMKQLREEESQDLSQVLSADQLSQWEQMQSRDRHKHDEEIGNSQGGTIQGNEGNVTSNAS